MKKRFVALGALLLAVLLGSVGLTMGRRGAQETVELVIATDLHYLAPELTDHGPYFQAMIERSDGKAMEYCEEITDAFLAQVIEQAPDGLILSGDLTFNGEKRSHEVLAEKLRRVSDAGIPVFVIPGNHDMENRIAASFQGKNYTLTDSVTPLQFSEIYRDFGYTSALARDEHSLSYTVQLSPTLCLLMVDVNGTEDSGSIPEETLDWVEQQLAAAGQQGMRVISVSHQNLLRHNAMFAFGFVMEGNDRLLELFEQYDVACHFSGHMHVQHIAQAEGGLPEIATSSLMVTPLQYGVLRLKGASGHYQTRQVEPSAEIARYAKTFFWDRACSRAQAALGDSPDAPGMAAYFADVNTAYFSGRMDTVEYDADQLEKWSANGAFLSLYLQSMADDAGKDCTAFSFDLSGE